MCRWIRWFSAESADFSPNSPKFILFAVSEFADVVDAKELYFDSAFHLIDLDLLNLIALDLASISDFCSAITKFRSYHDTMKLARSIR
jgi:hypothetical protein